MNKNSTFENTGGQPPGIKKVQKPKDLNFD